MIVPYSLDDNNEEEENNVFIKVLTPNQSNKSLIYFNLNLIQCSLSNEKKTFQWTSVESSSTLRGEFVRTTFLDQNIMYLSSGITYLRNLTTIDCLTKTIYQTDKHELFEINLKIESTLNDYCSNENLCYPLNTYQCDYQKQRCICRSSLQSYLTYDQHLICLNPVKYLHQCPMNNIRCLEWCHQNSSSAMCICPNDISKKKYFDNNRAYCEGRTNGQCNSFIQCPLGDFCLGGICQNNDFKFFSFDIITITIVISSLILIGIIIILAISICILRRQRWKKRYHHSSIIDPIYKKQHQQQHHQQQQQLHFPSTNDYDNVVYGVFRNNVPFSTINEENINDTSPFNLSDSASYRPKIVFLGGEQQLTAIYA